MKRPIWEKRIPTLFALLIVAGSIFLTGYFLQQQTSTQGRASQDTILTNIVISDITNSSFSVAFTTTTPGVAGVKVTGPSMPESVFFGSANQEAKVTHRITVPNLTPNTTYSFSVLLEGKTILNNDAPFSITTAPTFEENEVTQQVLGKILSVEGGNASDVLVVLLGEDSQSLTTITNQNGEYTFDIGKLRTTDLNNYASFAPTSLFTVEVYYKDLSSRTQIRYQNVTAIPPITLSQNYDFGISDPDEEQATSQAQFIVPTPSTTQSTFAITAPTQGQSLIDTRPVLRGTSSPLSQVLIKIDSQSETVTSDSSGRWQFRPVEPISQGDHIISVQSKDSLGVTKTLTRNFSIFPSGSQIAQSATPSATLTPTRTVTPTNAPSPTITSTPVPSPSVTIPPTPTTVITLAPTATSTPQPIITVTPTPPGSVTTMLVTFTSVILIVAGTTLLFILG